MRDRDLIVNWRWVKKRARFWRCRHRWMDGDTAGHKACRKCGVWRWWPVMRFNNRSVEPND